MGNNSTRGPTLPHLLAGLRVARPPAELLRAAGAAALGGGLAVELLAWIHGRKFPG